MSSAEKRLKHAKLRVVLACVMAVCGVVLAVPWLYGHGDTPSFLLGAMFLVGGIVAMFRASKV